MPSFAYWIAVTFVNSRTAPLEAGYIGLVMSVPTRPSCDEMLTMEPPPARRMAGMAALLPRNTPVALTSITRCHASSVVSSTRPTALMPALLTSTLSLPKRCSASATASCETVARVRRGRVVHVRQASGNLPPCGRRRLGAAHQGAARGDQGPGHHRRPHESRHPLYRHPRRAVPEQERW